MESLHDFQDLVADAVQAVQFKLIRTRNDVTNPGKSFPPLMAHQIFTENETIFGYRDLKITIMYTAGPLQIYLGIQYSSRASVQSDNIIEAITSKLPGGCYYTNLDEFLKAVDKNENFRPFGNKLHEYRIDNELGCRHFEIYHCDHQVPKFQAFFKRLQTFVLWFVDAASYIDVDDPQWTYFICYEKYKNDNGNFEYATVGYTTVYQYYAWPQNIRPRISQMLVLPPFQKLGIGTKFIETIYQYYCLDKNVIDITVEDPSDEFQRIRNYVDSKLCKNLSPFDGNLIKNGFNISMVKEAREKHKINPRQCRKIYEILRLYHTNKNNPSEMAKYRLNVKKRLNINYYKQLRDIEKLHKAGIDTQWMTATIPSMEERLHQLKAEYEDVVDEYQKVIKKLKE